MLTEQELLDKGLNNKNHITGRTYLGLQNQLALNKAGFSSHEWMTFLQIKQNGYKLKKGSEGIEVIHSEPIEKEEIDEHGNVTLKTTSHVTKHIVFNLDQVEKVSDPAKKKGPSPYEGQMITQKQRLFLIKLIESKYQDERIKAGLLNKVNELSKVEAKDAIQKMLAAPTPRY